MPAVLVSALEAGITLLVSVRMGRCTYEVGLYVAILYVMHVTALY